MSTPTSRARLLRGGLVGVCSALFGVTAHGWAAETSPHGGALATAALACLVTGAAIGELDLDGRRTRITGVVVGLCLAQAVCHVALTVVGGHHGAATPSTAMVVAHVLAALALGALICAAEYLYLVGTSVVTWLRLFATASVRPRRRVQRGYASAAPPRPVPVRSGLGMRAPPVPFVTFA